MKVHLLHEDQDFDFAAGLPPGHEELIQGLAHPEVIREMYDIAVGALQDRRRL